MAYLATKEDIDGYLEGDTLPLSGQGSAGGASVGASSGSTAAPLGGSSYFSNPFGAGTSLAGLGERSERVTGDVGELASEFYSAAGPSRTFGEPEKATLRGAIAGDEGKFSDALGLAGARYTGPAGLDEDVFSGLEYELGQIGAITDPLSRGEGLTSFELQRTPGLTPGEARFEAKRRVGEVVPEAGRLAKQSRQSLSEALRERKAAQEFATQRASEEEKIRAKSEALLGRQEGRLSERLAERAAEENARAESLGEAYSRFLETRNPADLAGYLTEEEIAGFDTASGQRRAEAEAAWNQIMSNPMYDVIKDIPVGTIQVDADGIERVHVDIGGQDFLVSHLKGGYQVIPGMTPERSMEIGRLLDRRQSQLEARFSPATGRTRNWQGATEIELSYLQKYLDDLAAQGYRGEFADVMPMYRDALLMGEALPPTRIEDYIDYTEAAQASPESVATALEAEKLNRIYDLLGYGADFNRAERGRAGVSATPEDIAAFNEAEAARRAQEEQALTRAEEAQLESLLGQRVRYIKSEEDDWLKPFAYLALTNPFTASSGLAALGLSEL